MNLSLQLLGVGEDALKFKSATNRGQSPKFGAIPFRMGWRVIRLQRAEITCFLDRGTSLGRDCARANSLLRSGHPNFRIHRGQATLALAAFEGRKMEKAVPTPGMLRTR